MEITLSTELLETIKTDLQATNPTVYWDYNNQLSMDQVKLILQGKANDVWNEIWEANIDNNYELEQEHIVKTLEKYKEQIAAELNEDVDDLDLKDLAIDLRDEFIDYISIDMDEEQLIRNTGDITVRVVMKSNYDSLESSWFYSQTRGYEIDSYFGEIIHALNLNPAKVKAYFKSKGVNCVGTYRNLKHRNGKEYVSYESLFDEILNTTTEGNKLVFVGKVDLKDFTNLETVNEVIIPKGNYCGLFDSYVGGGSILEMVLLKDKKIKLNKTGKSKYDYFELLLDANNSGYSINETYGVTNSFWGKKLTLNGKKYV